MVVVNLVYLEVSKWTGFKLIPTNSIEIMGINRERQLVAMWRQNWNLYMIKVWFNT